MVTTASSLVRSLIFPLLRAEQRLEELDAALDNAPMCAADKHRKALEADFERELKSYEAHSASGSGQ